MTSSLEASNSNFTSSGRPSTSTSDSAAFSIFNVTSEGCLIIGSCLIVAGVLCCTLVICLTGNPTSSNAFFLRAVLIWDLNKKTNIILVFYLKKLGFCKTYTVRNRICSLIWFNPSENCLTTVRSISISSSVHFLSKYRLNHSNKKLLYLPCGRFTIRM